MTEWASISNLNDIGAFRGQHVLVKGLGKFWTDGAIIIDDACVMYVYDFDPSKRIDSLNCEWMAYACQILIPTNTISSVISLGVAHGNIPKKMKCMTPSEMLRAKNMVMDGIAVWNFGTTGEWNVFK